MQRSHLRTALLLAAAPMFWSLTATAANWTNCGSEGGACAVPGAERLVMRYGDSGTGHYFYYGFDGQTSITCSNFNGDPQHGTTKSCAYTTSDTGEFGSTWHGNCANENQNCTVPDVPTWVRYGYGDRFFESVQSGTFSCSNGHFGIDPNQGQAKHCETGDAVLTGTITWNTCASEGSVCDIKNASSNNGILLRYGYGDRWTYRVATVSSIDCNNDRFGTDPNAGQKKVCAYTTLPPNAVTVGDWVEVATCNGKCSISETLEYGSSHSQSSTTEDTWSETVTLSMESGFEIDGVGEKVNESVASSYSHSSSFQSALSTSVSKSLSVDCGIKDDDAQKLLYQFTTGTNFNCLLSGACSGETFTLNTVCVTNPPVGYKGPQCAPNDCANTVCSVCKSNQ